MLSTSDPLSPAQVKAYHVLEFADGKGQYYTEGDTVEGEWFGTLAEEWGLTGAANREAFNRLADGQHPLTGEQLVEIQTPRLTTNRRGVQKMTMGHRAAWDLVFSPDKSVSVSALVGGHAAIRKAHEESGRETMTTVIEPWIQARIGGNTPAETTGRAIAVIFQHDSARPVNGYSAPQLHTHVVLFNMTRTDDGSITPLQTLETFRTQELAKRFYQSQMATRLHALGYHIEKGEYDQAVIAGYSPEYLEAASPRRQKILERLAEMKRSGAAAAQIAAHRTREAKVHLPPEQVLAAHLEMAQQFGNQPQPVVRAAQEREQPIPLSPRRRSAADAVTFAKDSVMEREAVADERTLKARALMVSLGDRRTDEILGEFERRVTTPEFVQVSHARVTPGRHFTTPDMQTLERDNIRQMLDGQHGDHRELADAGVRRDIERHAAALNKGQMAAVRHILSGRDQFQALDGPAGAGKTRTLAVIRESAASAGFEVYGFAPTSGAALVLQDAGIKSSTLQRFVQRERQDFRAHLYVLDESSLASTPQMRELMERLTPRDRVLLVGDVRQHQAVDAGTPYQQLIEAGLSIARLTEIMRQQQNPELQEVVTLFAKGQAKKAIERLDDLGMVHEVQDVDERHQRIAADYAQSPSTTLVIAPDNEERVRLNDVLHRTMQQQGRVHDDEHTLNVLVTRHDLTKADRKIASRYHVGDWVRFAQNSPARGIKAGDYARVTEVRAGANQLRLKREGWGKLTYDPKRLYGVTVYQEAERTFSVGDRVQFTAPERFDVAGKKTTIANRARGTVEDIGRKGKLTIAMDTGKTVTVDAFRQKHLDHGYAVTSHSSQGLTEDRTILAIDTDHASEMLVNQRMGYVGGSRPRDYLAVYTNDVERLARLLDRDVSKYTALSREEVQQIVAPARTIERHHAGHEQAI